MIARPSPLAIFALHPRTRLARRVSSNRRPGRADMDEHSLASLVAELRRYLYLPSYEHVAFAALVAVSSSLDGDPSGGCSSALLREGRRDHPRLRPRRERNVADITAPDCLLDRRPEERGRPACSRGSAAERSRRSVTFPALLSTSDRGGGKREEVYALLRRVLNGRVVSAKLGTAPRPLTWSGRLTLAAATQLSTGTPLTRARWDHDGSTQGSRPRAWRPSASSRGLLER